MRPPLKGTLLVLLLLPLLARGAAEGIEPHALFRWLEGAEPPLVIDARGRAAYLTATIPGALDAGRDPAGYLPDGRGGPVVLILAENSEPERIAAWVRRLERASHRVYLLTGDMSAWIGAGLPVENPEASFVRPGTVPFIIPRGICEMNEPAEEYK